MALIQQQELHVIRDTVTNKLMQGAKSQIAFVSRGAARRSLTHTDWWKHFKGRTAMINEMPTSGMIFSQLDTLQKEYDKQYRIDWRTIDAKLRVAIRKLNDELVQWQRDNRVNYAEAIRVVKFDNQSRYVVECLINIETKEK